uniref:Laminin G domain-containing protein n=1 Tax=Dendroctonus ponderosae TaxID=77166 RepID=A0AAR5PA03_DENPD
MGTNDHPLGEISVKVNDNQYHVIKFHRQGYNSTLQVDDYNVQSSFPGGNQLQVFNTQSQIQIGGKWSRGKKRIDRPFSGIISGVVVNTLHVLDLAAEKDVHASIRGDVALIQGILERHDHLQKMQQRINSEESEAVALIIGIIAGALIAVVLVILVIVKFKWRNDRSFKVDDSKEYPHGPGAALLGNTASSTTSQAQYQLNGALRNGDKAQMQQKQKKRDSKDIKEWYV